MNRRTQFLLTVASCVLLIASLPAAPFGPSGGGVQTGYAAGLFAFYGIAFLFTAGGGTFAACVLAAVANLAYAVSLILNLFRPGRRAARIASILSVVCAIASVMTLRYGHSELPWLSVWPGLGLGFWLWILAMAMLLCASVVLRESPRAPLGFAIEPNPIPALIGNDQPATPAPAGNRGLTRPPLIILAGSLVVVLVMLMLWSWAMPWLMVSAARGGHFSSVKAFRAMGVDANALCPMFLDAARAGDRDAVRSYLKLGVDPNVFEDTRTALYEAIRRRDLSMMTLLLDHGANPNQLCGLPGEALLPSVQAFRANNDAMIQLLASHGGIAPSSTPADAILTQRMGPDPAAFAKSPRGSRLLQDAIDGNDKPTVKALLDAGADPNAPDPRTGLLPIFCGEGDIEAMLLAHGADINAHAPRGQITAVHFAVERHDLATLRRLLDHGAMVNSQDNQGYTPLHVAVARRFIEEIKLLLDHNADPSLADNNGRSAILHSQMPGGDPAITALLKSHLQKQPSTQAAPTRPTSP